MVGLITEVVASRVLNMTHYMYNATFYCMIWCMNYCSSYNTEYISNCNKCTDLYNCANSTTM